MLDEFHFEEDVTCLIYPIVRPIKIRLMTVFSQLLVLFITESQGVVLWVLGVFGDDFALVLVFDSVDDFGVHKVTLRCKAFDCKADKVTRLPA